MLRIATPSDALSILEIYAPYILNTTSTYETEVPSIDAFAERIITYLQQWPWLVYEIDGVIAGYAYAGRYRERAAYQWCAEVSVYVHDKFHRRGIAQTLYSSLFKILQEQGYRNIYAVINLPNERSVKLHESLGFKWFATYENVGYKLDRWTSVGWWQLSLNPYNNNPQAPIKFPEVTQVFLSEVLNTK